MVPTSPGWCPASATLPATGSDPDSERLRLFGAVVELLARAGEETPVVVVLDDLHWADESSLAAAAPRRPPQGRLPGCCVVGTYRDTDLSRTHPLAAALADLRRESGVERVALAGLDRGEVEDFLTLAGDGRVNADDVADAGGDGHGGDRGQPLLHQ